MRSVRLCFMCLALFVLSCLGLPNRAYAAPIDLMENQNEIMGTVSKTNWFADQSTLPRYMDTYWQYTSSYSEDGTTSGTESVSGSEAAHTVTSSVSVPSYKITTAAYTATLRIEATTYAPYGFDEGGVYEIEFFENTSHAASPKIAYPSVQDTVAAHTETGTLSVPKVTVSSSGTFSAQDTRVGVNEPWMYRLKLNGFTSTQENVYAVMSFTGISMGGIDTGAAVHTGDIIKPVINPKPIRIDGQYTNRWLYDVKYFGFWGGAYHEFEIENDGTLRIPHESLYVVLLFRINNVTIPSGAKYLYVNKPSLLLYNDFGLDKLSNDMESYTQQQTEELKDTTGADSVLSDIAGQGSVMAQKLGFVYQTGAIARNLYDAMQYEGEGTVTFPALAWEGQTIIAETDVPITGWLPSSIEDRVRDGVTLVFFLAWLHGMHSLYARIFLGQIETESGDD